MLGHFLEYTSQKVLTEVPIIHFEVDVLLDDLMPSGSEHGRESGETEIGFGGVPVGGEDQHDLHLPTACGFRGLPMQLNQSRTGPFPFRIVYFHASGPCLTMKPSFRSKPAKIKQIRSILFARSEVGQGSLTRIIHERFCCNRGFPAGHPLLRDCHGSRPACGLCGMQAGGLATQSVNVLFTRCPSIATGGTQQTAMNNPGYGQL